MVADDDALGLRREQRYALSEKVRLSWQDERGGLRYCIGEAVNISESGLAIRVDKTIPVQSYVSFEVPKMRLKGSASVRFVRRKGLKQIVGLSFSQNRRWDPQRNPIPGARKNQTPTAAD